jgi:two-component system invasion response regulator UvrY
MRSTVSRARAPAFDSASRFTRGNSRRWEANRSNMRILIADDHAIVRRGLSEILLEAYPSAEIEQVGDADTLLQQVPGRKLGYRHQRPDDAGPERAGSPATDPAISAALPVLILSIFPEEQYATRVFKAGASGYINKDAAPTELVKAVQRILQGRKYITPAVLPKSLASDLTLDNGKAPHELLSDREFHVMKLLAAGKPSRTSQRSCPEPHYDQHLSQPDHGKNENESQRGTGEVCAGKWADLAPVVKNLQNSCYFPLFPVDGQGLYFY